MACSIAIVIYTPLFSIVPAYAEETSEWKRLLSAPPARCVEARKELLARATQLVQAMPRRKRALVLDVVVSGCGFMVLHYLGVHSILSRLEARGDMSLHRFAGASSGAKTPLHLLLAGEVATMDQHLAYGDLCAQRGGSLLHAACRNDRCGRVTFEHLVETCSAQMQAASGRAHVCVAQLTRRGPRRAVLSEFGTDPAEVQRAREYWHATGTLLTRVEGLGWCSDGGLAGNTPLFEDGARDQLLVQPQRAGLPRSMVFTYTAEQAVAAVRQGQDEAAAMLARVLAEPEDAPAAVVKGDAPGRASPSGSISIVRPEPS